MSNENTQKHERPYDVLIVEDNVDDADLCLRTMQKAQHDLSIEFKAQAVTKSTEAEVKIREKKFDVILLDVNMPPPDGIELTKRIRASDMNRTTPVVIITGAEDHGLMNRAFQVGANWFLFKPVERTRLLQVIQVARVPMERERRKMQRIRVKCPVSLEFEQGRLDGETLDLSLKGMLVGAKRILPVGTNVKVSLTLPGNSAPVRAAARVVRVVGNDFMGLELERMGNAETDRLGAFLVPLIVAAGKQS